MENTCKKIKSINTTCQKLSTMKLETAKYMTAKAEFKKFNVKVLIDSSNEITKYEDCIEALKSKMFNVVIYVSSIQNYTRMYILSTITTTTTAILKTIKCSIQNT